MPTFPDSARDQAVASIRRYFREHWLHDFQGSKFDREDELETFMHRVLTDHAREKLRLETRASLSAGPGSRLSPGRAGQ